MKYRHHSIKIFLAAISLTLLGHKAIADQLDIADLPLFVASTMPPNIVLTLDDSGSMQWAYVPDNGDDYESKNRFKSSYFNAIYYNPDTEYTPPPKYNGRNCTLDASNPVTCYPNVSFTAAPINGFDTSKGSVNLSSNYRSTKEYSPNSNSQTFTSSPSSGGHAFYYVFDSSNTNCNGTKSDDDCYDYVDVTTQSATAQQNFANWYSYYRTRNLATVSGAMSGFSGINGNIRVAWQAINSCNSFDTNCDGWGDPGRDIDNRIRRLNAVTRTETTTTITGTTTATTHHSYTCSAVFNSRDSSGGSSDNENKTDRIELTNCNRTAPSAASNTSPPSSGDGSPKNADSRQIIASSCSSDTSYCKTYTADSNQSSDSRIYVNNQISSDKSITKVTLSWDQTTTTNTTTTTSRDITHKEDLYAWLSRFPALGGTYLLASANKAGKYFQGTIDVHHPFAEDPQITEGTLHSCRRNVHVMMTDGSWCGDSASDTYKLGTSSGIGDANSSTNTVPLGPNNATNYAWTPTAPYRDGQSTNLADIAFYYWANDLQTNLTNNINPIIREASTSTNATVKNNEEWFNAKNDPATWQHLTTYTVGLGLSGSLVSPYPAWDESTFAGDYDKLKLGTSCPTNTTSSSPASAYCWPYTKNAESCSGYTANTPAKVYDLWHAAIASRGKFYGTESAADLVTAFNSILSEVSDESMTAAALAANSTGLQTNTLLYQAQFDATDWSGHLYAYPVDTETGVPGAALWDGANGIPTSNRNVLTYTGTTGVSFDSCDTLSSAQKVALNSTDNRCADRIAWLRGGTISDFRQRPESLLGDIINSDPAYAKNYDFGYTSLPTGTSGQSTYAQYLSDQANRTAVIYVGGNDGMLHAFQADTGETNSGKELFAYIPAGVYDHLSALTSIEYNHQYYVDSGPKVSDAYLNGAWKTVLLGGLGKGGKTVYALDVTDPNNFVASMVMWEFPNAANLTADSTLADQMGYSFSQPQLARLNDGNWAAIFGNGYNSVNEQAYLFIVNLNDGSLIKKIATNTTTSNGLSTPYLYDTNGDKIIDAVYAGDLQGNLWKFDLSATDHATWSLGNGAVPLFTARNSLNQVQPITAPPVVGGHPEMPDSVMVYFGTGSYITTTDAGNTNIQSFYAIWDKSSSSTVSRSLLQEQTIIDTVNAFGFNIRLTSSNTVNWGSMFGWYMDLVSGERVYSSALLKHDRVVFATTIPNSDPCDPGGTTWLMELDLVTGGASGQSAFDFNNDDQFDDLDKFEVNDVKYTVTGLKSTVGIAKAPVWLEDDANTTRAFKEMSGTSGSIMTVKNRAGGGGGNGSGGTVNQEYWIQIQ